jgi:hypothetical protein
VDRQKRWKETERKVRRLADGLGLGIDPGIRQMVITLICLGFKTSASCEGHARYHGLPYPWVDIEVTNKNARRVFLRLMKLLEEFYDERDGARDAHLVLRPGKTSVRLQGVGGDILQKLPRELLTYSVRSRLGIRYRKEMNDFQKFLEKKYFDGCPLR